MICLAVTFIARSGEEDELIKFLGIMTEHTRKEPGNLMYLAHRSPTEPNRFFLYEQYTDQAALEAHRNAPYFVQYVTNGFASLLESRVAEIYESLA